MNNVLFVLGILGLPLVLSSCDKSSDTSDNQSNAVLSSFDGTFRYGSNNDSSEGYVSVDDDEFSFVNEYGSLTGSVELVEDLDATYYQIDISDGEGIFEDQDALQGEMYSDYLGLSGVNSNGETVSIEGTVTTVEELNAEWEQERTKALVTFTNTHSCDAYITINYETLGPLEKHWKEGGYTDETYGGVLLIPKNVDNGTSYLSCKDITLKTFDGSYKTYTKCQHAYFVVDKETSYTYTVEWDNGEVTTGTIAPLAGGHKKYIVLSNNGAECNYDEDGESTTEREVEFNIDYNSSNLPSADEDLLSYFDTNYFTISTTTVSGVEYPAFYIGSRYSSVAPDGYSDMQIDLYFRSDVENGSYEVKKWSWSDTSAPICVGVWFGSRGASYSNQQQQDASGTITVSDYDSETKSCTITFTDVNLLVDGYNLNFSAKVSGSFDKK